MASLDDNERSRRYNHYVDIEDSWPEDHVTAEGKIVMQMVHALLVHKGQDWADKEAKARVVEKGLHEHWDEDYKFNALQDYFERRVCAELTSTSSTS